MIVKSLRRPLTPDPAMSKMLDRAFVISAGLFVAAAIYHFLHLIQLVASGSKLPGATFHAAFVLIDLLAAVGLYWRPIWFAAPFSALTIQQILSHGSAAWNAWQDGVIDVISWAVISVLPIILVLLILDAVRRRQLRPSNTGG